MTLSKNKLQELLRERWLSIKCANCPTVLRRQQWVIDEIHLRGLELFCKSCLAKRKSQRSIQRVLVKKVVTASKGGEWHREYKSKKKELPDDQIRAKKAFNALKIKNRRKTI
jgi:hypothetical protein